MFENFSRWNHVLIGVLVVFAFIILNYYTLYKPKQKSLKMENQDVFEYFDTNDGLDITWYHRANSMERLKIAINDDGVKMIEADIIFWKLKPTDKKPQPVMGHGKEEDLDLTAFHFIDTVISQKKKKGIKLDFKDIKAVEPTLRYLKLKKDEINFPVWLNADTVLGPGGTEQQVDGMSFIALANEYCPSATLSLGFSYKAASSTPLTQSMVKEMYELTTHSSSQVTFAINVAMFASSLSSVSWLMHQEPKRFTVTLWTSMAGKNWEGVNPKSICKIRSELPKTTLFYDLSVHLDTWQEFLKLCAEA